LSILEARASDANVGDGRGISVAVGDWVIDTDGATHPDRVRLSTKRLRQTTRYTYRNMVASSWNYVMTSTCPKISLPKLHERVPNVIISPKIVLVS
jgi:hypothetical protein